MARLAELLAQLEKLNAEIETTRAREKEEELPRLIALVEDYRITEVDLFGKPSRSGPGRPPGEGRTRAPRTPSVGKGIPKYRDPESGKTWSGLGRKPAWFDSKQSDRFEIKT